ncbi:MAG: hypothetical protein KY468_11935, partial [Armatimonadetes bacterium]|nr:hypothetical protein [Armatimonadota bacterium]
TVLYVGNDEGAKLLDFMGVLYSRAAAPDPSADLVILGPGAQQEGAEAYARNGGKVLVLPRTGYGPYITRRKASDFAGSRNVPSWPEARGLSASDLRWRSFGEAVLFDGGPFGVEIGADGLLARRKVGRGVIVYTQIDPTALPADEKTYFRFTRWRQTRTLAQLLSNMGATFKQDARQLALIEKPAHALFLAGPWDAVFTRTFPESPTRNPKNPDPPLSEEEKALVSLNPPKADWQKVEVPAYMESYGKGWIDGGMVFRKTVNLPEYFAGKDLVFSVGRVDESEVSFFNGTEIGRSRDWLRPRKHTVPGKLVKAGENLLALRSWDQETHGGWSGEPVDIHLRLKTEPNDFYHPDYLPDRDFDRPELWPLADNPYRYVRW